MSKPWQVTWRNKVDSKVYSADFEENKQATLFMNCLYKDFNVFEVNISRRFLPRRFDKQTGQYLTVN